MSEDSDSVSEEERSLFRPFTRESLAAIEARIAEEHAKQKELEKKRAEGEVGTRPCFFFIHVWRKMVSRHRFERNLCWLADYRDFFFLIFIFDLYKYSWIFHTIIYTYILHDRRTISFHFSSAFKKVFRIQFLRSNDTNWIVNHYKFRRSAISMMPSDSWKFRARCWFTTEGLTRFIGAEGKWLLLGGGATWIVLVDYSRKIDLQLKSPIKPHVLFYVLYSIAKRKEKKKGKKSLTL